MKNRKVLVYCSNFQPSAAPCEARQNTTPHPGFQHPFQLTCPVRGTTRVLISRSVGLYISTHVPHAGHDCRRTGGRRLHRNFNSRAPCGARPVGAVPTFVLRGFQLTCPMRGTTLLRNYGVSEASISTHVPHAGHDGWTEIAPQLFANFNSRAPCGARRSDHRRESDGGQFQLTCPMRGTT